MAKVIAIVNQKGGVGKTTTTVNLGVGFANRGKRVLLIDADAQGSLTAALGFQQPDRLNVTLASVMQNLINEYGAEAGDGILHTSELADLLPANIDLSALEASLVNVMMGRESILKSYISVVSDEYDYILIDCSPSLGMVTVNALYAADSVIIPVQAAYLPVKGLQQLIRTVGTVQRYSPQLKIGGILITMADFRTNYARDIAENLRAAYGAQVHIFETRISASVRAAEAALNGTSIYKYDPACKVAKEYAAFTTEVLVLEEEEVL